MHLRVTFNLFYTLLGNVYQSVSFNFFYTPWVVYTWGLLLKYYALFISVELRVIYIFYAHIG